MASQAPNMLPLLYNGLEPLNRNVHGNFKVRRLEGLDRGHGMPFGDGRRVRDGSASFSIVFSVGDNLLSCSGPS
jgi:hypothetical protein